jgi:hypothetical protein
MLMTLSRHRGEIVKETEVARANGRWSSGVRTCAIVFVCLLLFLAIWAVVYPRDDPKGLEYTLWKAGAWKMDLSEATGIMVGDSHHDELVVGKTRQKIEKRFGPLLTLDQATPYEQFCLKGSDWEKEEPLFIRQNPWMILFNNGKATDIIFIKGC